MSANGQKDVWMNCVVIDPNEAAIAAPTHACLDVPGMTPQRELLVAISDSPGNLATVHDPVYNGLAVADVNALDVNGYQRGYRQTTDSWYALEVYTYGGGSFGSIDSANGSSGVHYISQSASILFAVNQTTTDADPVALLPSNSDDQVAAQSGLIGTVARLFGFDGTTFDRLRTLASDSDAQAAAQIGLLGVVNRLFGFNGTTFDRIRTGAAAVLSAFSSVGALLTTRPGDWAITHTPAAATQATISRAAGAAGVRHICTGISATLIGLAASAEATILVNLRDGATGAGTILASWRLLVTGTTGSETGIALTGLNIPGSAATAMTLEFAAAGGADTFQTVALQGYDAS